MLRQQEEMNQEQTQGWAGGSVALSRMGKDIYVKLHVLSKLVRLGVPVGMDKKDRTREACPKQ